MIIKTRLTKLNGDGQVNLSELAKAIDISVKELCRILEGSQEINEHFIVNTIRAFPEYSLDQIFYFSH